MEYPQENTAVHFRAVFFFHENHRSSTHWIRDSTTREKMNNCERVAVIARHNQWKELLKKPVEKRSNLALRFSALACDQEVVGNQEHQS
jgi:hypothetical protein